MSDEVYKKLIEHHNTWLFEMPESEHLIPLLKARLSPEDAEFFCQIPFIGHTAEQLSKKTGIPVKELVEKLDKYAEEGLIYRTQGKSTRYNLTEVVFMYYRMPGWTGLDNEWHRKVSKLSNKYYHDVFAEYFLKPHSRGLRAIPINKTIKDTKTILPYEDIIKYMDEVEFYSVGHCACRTRYNLDDEHHDCKHETENCLHFDRLGRYTVDYGFGREITKEETLEILKKSADAGLVHGISNSQEGIDTICNCCPDCCLYLEKAAKVLPVEYWGHQPSNYIRKFDAKKCSECYLCVKKCPMEALSVDNGEIKFVKERCIGCGVCAHLCPSDAIVLVQRKEPVIVSKNGGEFVYRYMHEQGRSAEEAFKKNMLS